MAYCRFAARFWPRGALLSSLRQGNSHCPPLPAVRRAPARREPFLQRLRLAVAGAAPAASGTPAAPPGSAARNSLGRGRTILSPHLKWHRLLHRLQCHRRTAPPRRGYACLLCRIREISPAPCSAFFGADGSCYIPRRRNVRLSGTVFHELHRRAGTHRQKRRNVVLSRPADRASRCRPCGSAQILTSAPEGRACIIAPTIYFVSPDGAMRPFMDAAETLTRHGMLSGIGCLSPIWGLLRKSRRPMAAPCAATVLM